LGLRAKVNRTVKAGRLREGLSVDDAGADELALGLHEHGLLAGFEDGELSSPRAFGGAPSPRIPRRRRPLRPRLSAPPREEELVEQFGKVGPGGVALEQGETRQQRVLLVQLRRLLEAEQRTRHETSRRVEHDDAFALAGRRG
jgi:hypothetical protein